MRPVKPIIFVQTSRQDLLGLPPNIRRQIGYQLDLVQNGVEPDDWKPMASIGAGVQEIRVKDETGAYRTLYVAKFEEGVYVLHIFQKKTQKTSQHDLDLAEKRYRSVLKERQT